MHDTDKAGLIMVEAVALLIKATDRRRAELRERPEALAQRQGIDPDRYHIEGRTHDYDTFLGTPEVASIRARWVSAVKAEREAKGMDPALDVDSYFPGELAETKARMALT